MPRPFSQVRQTTWVFLLSGATGMALQLALYLRPSPFGTPYVLDVTHYLPAAILYEWYSAALLSLPFVLLGLQADRRARDTPWLVRMHVGVTSCALAIGHVDHEVQRFMGMHLSFDLLAAYDMTRSSPTVLWRALLADQGGPLGGLFLLVPIAVFPALTLRLARRLPLAKSLWYPLATAAFVVCVALPFTFRTSLFGSKNRQARVAPAVVLLRDEVLTSFEHQASATLRADDLATVRAMWQAADPSRWAFTSEAFPMLKTYVGPQPEPTPQQNVILIMLETFRAWDMASFNPAFDATRSAPPTPFLDGLVQSGRASFWPHFICNGQPTIVSFMTLHTSVLPHSHRTVAKNFTYTRFPALPELLRGHGYHTAFFTGSDPDWDNQRHWLNRWYHDVRFDPAHGEQDRLVFRDAAQQIVRFSQERAPFFATVMSISNHLPFISPESAFATPRSDDPRTRIRQTMAYTDDVLREFFATLKQSGVLDNTLVVITGDHGYDLGERGKSGGHENARHETTWVPLLIVGQHPRLAPGRHNTPASHIDVAPTVIDLLGITDNNAFFGHSLVHVRDDNAYACNMRDNNFAFETASTTAFFAAYEDPLVFMRSDVLQMQPLHVSTGQQQTLGAQVRAWSRVTDALIESDSLTPP